MRIRDPGIIPNSAILSSIILCSPCPNFLASTFLVYPIRKLVSPKKTQFCFKTNLNLSRQYSKNPSHILPGPFLWNWEWFIVLDCRNWDSSSFICVELLSPFSCITPLHLCKQDYNTLSFWGATSPVQCLVFTLYLYISFLAYYSHYVFIMYLFVSHPRQ